MATDTIAMVAPEGMGLEEGAVEQIRRCAADQHVTHAALMADHHKGYGMPIGGVIASPTHVAPGGVGYDIGCGNKAVRTNLLYTDIKADLPRLMDEIYGQLSFGVGRKNAERAEHPLIDDADRWKGHVLGQQALGLASSQLGTIGSGNHYVDLLVDDCDRVWIGVHFGSRGLGHKTATHFLKAIGSRDDMDAAPLMIDTRTELGQSYLHHMRLAGDFAYAGRDWVCDKVRRILGADHTHSVHNHHNYAWLEWHDGQWLWVVRKGATPAGHAVQGFIGGSMGDDAVIVSGFEDGMIALARSSELLRSTVHGAGRVMSRTAARGKTKMRKVWKCGMRGCDYAEPHYMLKPNAPRPPCPVHQHKMIEGTKEDVVSVGAIDWPTVQGDLRSRGLELRGAGADEAPGAYKRLPAVLAGHASTINILYTLRPVGVAMAGADINDPFRD